MITSLFRYFLSPVPEPRSFWKIVKWWEIRRIFYNLVMIPYGVLIYYLWFANFELFAPGDECGPLFLVFALGFLFIVVPIIYVMGINIFYCLGWIIEGIWNRRDQKHWLRGPRIMLYGYLISMVIVALPLIIAFMRSH